MHKKIPNIFTFISNFKKEEIEKLDKNIGIILRNYKEKPDINKIRDLGKLCRLNNKKLYLANNLKLAINLNLDGVYIPSFNKNLNQQKFSKKKDFLYLGSAHNLKELKIKEKQGVEIIFLSPLFKTKNYKNGMGIIKFNNLAQKSNKKIIALGGINIRNIKKLKITNACGFSAISYFEKKF